jgi:hypothetical protein
MNSYETIKKKKNSILEKKKYYQIYIIIYMHKNSLFKIELWDDHLSLSKKSKKKKKIEIRQFPTYFIQDMIDM